ncbi:MAG TPA: hypothetical protein VM290_04460 [Gaiellaceae bacterium]|nr:hypothetical protein [Gaiellaceae bacterium]
MRSRSGVAIVAVAATLAALGLAAMAARGLYGVAVAGVVTRIEVRHEKRPPVDDVHLLHLDGRVVHVDGRVADAVRVGDRVEKGVLETRLRVEGEAVPLAPSVDLRRSLVALPVLLALVVALLFAARLARR